MWLSTISGQVSKFKVSLSCKQAGLADVGKVNDVNLIKPRADVVQSAWGLAFTPTISIFFGQLPSELTERNSTKTCHVFGS